MPLVTTLLVSVAKSASIEEVADGMMGYRVDLAVTQAVNIDSKVFVLLREVLSAGSEVEGDSEPHEDTFYSVASVGQLESVPEAPTSDMSFYRVSSVSLVFESLGEMEKGLLTILEMIDLLRQANDLTINMLPATVLAYPPETLARFWGLSADTTIDDDELLVHRSGTDLKSSKVFDIAFTNIFGPRYVFFAYPNALGAITTAGINNLSVSVVLVTRNVQTVPGTNVSYNIYRTTATVAEGPVLLETT